MRQALSRPYDFSLDRIDAAGWEELEHAPCAFCGSRQRAGRDMRNIAVLSRAAAVDADNVAPCCPLCWSTRAGASPADFRAHASRIARYAGSRGRAQEYGALMRQRGSPASARFSRDMRRRDKQKCGGSDTDHDRLSAQLSRFPCWYCGRASTGADRVDSAVCPGYSPQNVVPCCTLCNSMKHVLPRGTFLRHMQHVVRAGPGVSQS